MKKGKLIIISGPSGVGKGTIINELLKENKNLHYSISMTTRKKRENEIDNVNYYFVTPEEFKENIKNNKLIEYAEVYENLYYGTPKDKVEENLNNGKHVILEIDVEGMNNIKKYDENAISIFIAPPSLEELESRLRNRKTETEEKINERIKKAEYELEQKKYYDYIIINDDLEKAIKETKNIINTL